MVFICPQMTPTTKPTRTADAKKLAAVTAATASVANTTAPVQPANVDTAEPEFVRLPGLQRLFGIKRGHAYQLLHSGEISGVSLRRRGSPVGVRLVSVASVRAYLRRQAAEPAFVPRRKDTDSGGAA
jgi:hypothetical protein